MQNRRCPIILDLEGPSCLDDCGAVFGQHAAASPGDWVAALLKTAFSITICDSEPLWPAIYLGAQQMHAPCFVGHIG